ncbi:Protein IMPACT [Hondaea fermentalgiana]|uniref:Protein IMPACT n=1 Tax=Hondaea fermentalgiana TaxID=2315210 RepID=A0A2R5GDC0_9STRA|nr:Protein IMPACT [Hondaea fermentalgiana]|eukprot:GBG26171.1 Protein IMPACT [Hondaea fermentalgiana]
MVEEGEQAHGLVVEERQVLGLGPEGDHARANEDHVASAFSSSSGIDLDVTHGPIRALPGNRRVQAHVAPVTHGTDTLHVIASLQDKPEWSEVSCWPSAFRVASFAAPANDDFQVGLVDVEASIVSGAISRELEEDTLEEDCSDGDYTGAGDKLLHLLRRWDIYNCVVVISVWEEGCSRFRKGPVGARLKIVVDCAKEVLEQCFYAATGSCIVPGSADFASMASLHRLPASVSRIESRDEIARNQNGIRSIKAGLAMTTLSQCSDPAAKQRKDQKKSKRRALPLGKCEMIGEDDINGFREEMVIKEKPISTGHFMAGRDKEEDRQRLQQHGRPSERRTRRRGRVFRVQAIAPDLAEDDLRQLRSLTKPHRALVEVWQQAGRLLGHPEDELDWQGLRPLFASRATLLARMADFRVPIQTLKQVKRWIANFYPGSEGTTRIVKASPVAWKVFDWLRLITSSSISAPAAGKAACV